MHCNDDGDDHDYRVWRDTAIVKASSIGVLLPSSWILFVGDFKKEGENIVPLTPLLLTHHVCMYFLWLGVTGAMTVGVFESAPKSTQKNVIDDDGAHIPLLSFILTENVECKKILYFFCPAGSLDARWKLSIQPKNLWWHL